MSRRPEIGNVQLYPDRPLRASDKNGYVLKFYCPIRSKRIRRNCGTRDRREARRIMRECRERLLNGKYIESDGAIAEPHEQLVFRPTASASSTKSSQQMTWQECFEHFYNHRKQRVRPKSLADAASRIQIAQRVLDGYREDRGLSTADSVQDYMTLDALEYLQDRLLAGDESRFDSRSPMTVNTTIGAVMTFCYKHGWIEKLPPSKSSTWTTS